VSLCLTFAELLAYNEGERAKWDEWFRRQDAAVFSSRLHTTRAFATAWDLLDHMFVVEQRHLQRLRSEYPLPETSGVTRADWAGLMSYAANTRRELIESVEATPAAQADEPRPVPIWGEPRMITPRKLVFHVLLHEIRHWAQISLAVRNAGFEPPADQDLVFSSALR
jgi:uncharacterized damage-inducible protein DinB